MGKTFSAFAATAFLLALFSGAQAAEFKPEAFFAGQTFSAGEVDAAFSKPERFTARFIGKVSHGALSMDERFTFAHAKRLQRWSLRSDGKGGYRGTVRTETADGVLREARPVTGKLTPTGGVLSYDGYAPNGGDTILHFRHSMEAQADGTVRNRVAVSKLGLPVATADVVFSKTGAVSSN